MAQHLPIQASLSVKKKTTHQMQEQQRFRLARPTRRQAKLLQTAWRYLLTARRQRLLEPLVSRHRLAEHSVPLGATQCSALSC